MIFLALPAAQRSTVEQQICLVILYTNTSLVIALEQQFRIDASEQTRVSALALK
jgi:hypothetical protein